MQQNVRERIIALTDDAETMAEEIKLLRDEVRIHERELFDLDMEMRDVDVLAILLEETGQTKEQKKLFQQNAPINRQRLALQHYIEWKSKRITRLVKDREQILAEIRRLKRVRS